MSQALWEKIFAESVKELESPAYSAGDQFGTVDSLSRRYQVSAITARRVLSELAAAGYVKNIPKRGSIVTPRGTSQYTVPCYFLPPDRPQPNPIPYAMKQQGLFTAAAANSLPLEMVSLEQLPDIGADGKPAILFSVWNSLHIPAQVYYHALRSNVYPIAIGCNPDQPISGLRIAHDGANIMRDMVTRFVKAGCCRIAYLGDTYDYCFKPRFDGYVQALADNHIPFSLQQVFHKSKEAELSAEELAAWLKTTRPDAICTPGTEFSNSLIHFLENTDFPWYGHIATVGSANRRHPTVQLYRGDFFRMGQLAVELALKMIQPDSSLAIPEQTMYYVPAIWEPSICSLKTYLTQKQRSHSCPPIAN